MKMKFKITNRILSIVLAVVIAFGIMPMTAFALGEGEHTTKLFDGSTYKFTHGTEAEIWLYTTPFPTGIDIVCNKNTDDTKVFTVDYDKDKWQFAGWKTWFRNKLGTVNTDNPNFDLSGTYYFSKVGAKETEYNGTDESIQVNKEYQYGGVFYLHAIFKPVFKVEIDSAFDTVNSSACINLYVSEANHNNLKIADQVKTASYATTYGKGAYTIDPAFPPPYDTLKACYIANGADVTQKVGNASNDTAMFFYVTEPTTVKISLYLPEIKVAYSGNGGTGTMQDQEFHFNQAQALTGNIFTRTGYTFTGWNTAVNGSGTAYSDKQNVTFLYTEDTSLTLYAQWKECTDHNYENGVCTECGENCSHSGGTATCLEQAVCTACGLKYGSPLAHQYVYSSKDNVITEKCTNGCNHSETATLEQDTGVNTFYTGNAIEALDITYSDNWQGGELTIDYSDNTYVGTAKGSISIENAEAMQTFAISYFSVPGNAYSISGEAYINESVYWFGGSHMTATVKPAADYQISKEQNGIYTDSIVFNNGDEKVYLKRISDGAISDAIDLSDIVKFDTTLPDGEIRLDERNGWQEFNKLISFGLFYKEDKAATVIYSDADSGVNSVEYYIASGDLIADENLDNAAAAEKLEAVIGANWNTYSTEIDLNDNARNVIYAKVTDNVGNVTYLSSDGIVLDSIAPTLEGIEDGQTYYGDLTVIKSAEQFYDIKTVTLDGEAMGFEEGTYGLIPADNTEHTVVVEDHAGNKTTYTVTVMKNYTVTFKVDGETVSTETVGYGKDATVPAIPEKEGYTEAWDKDGKNITADTEINAVYTIKEYTITFMDENGVYKTLTVKHGERVTMPDVPTKDGYTVKWENTIDKATGDATIKAVYTELPKTDTPSSPQTGDNSNIWLWVALLFVSGAGLLGITLNERNRKVTSKKMKWHLNGS